MSIAGTRFVQQLLMAGDADVALLGKHSALAAGAISGLELRHHDHVQYRWAWRSAVQGC